ncbi:MAG: FAD-dependent oxidoreductase [Eubacteriales bacterium]|nr:FAD-dependent oxidoreductase [Eubacteriales bacterium]
MESIWSKTVKLPAREPLKENLSVDAAVIGAGMSGILTAYLLKKSGMSVAVLEADRIAGGQTKNTTAKITSQHGLTYEKLLRRYGERRARLYARANEAAILEYEMIIRENQIDCHFERLPAYLYTVEPENRGILLKEAEAAAWLGLPARFQERVNLPLETLPMKTAGAVCFERQAQFHPLEFIREISKNLTIYEETRVLSVKGKKIRTDRGAAVTAEHIIFAAHFPFVNVPGFYFARQHQERSYVVAYENAADLNGMYYSIDENGLSFRNYENLLFVGGGAHRTGENKTGGRYRQLRNQAEALYPKAKEVAHWSAQDCMPHDGLPFIGTYSMMRENWYVATGFQKWGMTTSMVAAMMIRDMVCGVESPYEKLFTPQRIHPAAAAKSAVIDVWKSVAGLTRGLFLPSGRKTSPGEPTGGRQNPSGGRQHPADRSSGDFSGTPSRCPHMGCGLKWNPDEESWDCPCHGSRFDCHGNLKDDPAQSGLGR